MSNYLKTAIVSPLVPYSFTGGKTSYSAALDGASAQLGFRFYPVTTSQITHIAWYEDITGTMTGITWVGEIQTDTDSEPSGVVLGAATAATAARTSDGWSAEVALGTATGALSVTTPYWLVIRDGGGTNPTGSNNMKLQHWGSPVSAGQVRKYGVNWSANVVDADGVFYCLHADGNVTGYPITSTFAVTTLGSVAGKMYGTSGYGVKMQFQQNQEIDAVSFRFLRTGAPGDITITLADSAGTTIESLTYDKDRFLDDARNLLRFSSSHIMPGGTDFYIVFSTTGGASAYYTPYTVGVNSTYVAKIAGTMRFIYGDSSAPAAMTVDTSEIPAAFGVLNTNGPAGGTTGKLASFNAGFN